MGQEARFLTPAEIYDLSQQAPSLSHFRRELLFRLQKCVGFDAGFFHQITPGPLDRRTVFGCPESLLPSSRGQYMRRYTASFEPVFRALRSAPVVIDSELFGVRALHEQPYFADILLPIGLRQCLYSTVRFRDQAPALLTMARESVGSLSHTTRDRLASVLPVIALADAGLAACADQSETTPGLTAKQKELLGYLRVGLSNKDIAQALGISPNTVRNRLVALFEAFGVRSRTELVVLTSSGRTH